MELPQVLKILPFDIKPNTKTLNQKKINTQQYSLEHCLQCSIYRNNPNVLQNSKQRNIGRFTQWSATQI